MVGVEILELDEVVARAASAVEPATIRTFDAIHLASADVLRPELDAFVTYHDRLAQAARSRGLRVLAPGADGPAADGPAADGPADGPAAD